MKMLLEESFDKNLLFLLKPFSFIYQVITDLRNWFYDKGIFRSYSVNAPVISVGNIAAGGTGKTPFVILILQTLIEHGHKPMVVSRGYGGSSGKIPVAVPSKGDFRVYGDEPIMISSRFPSVPIVISHNRVKGANWGLSRFQCDCVVLDDAYQHRRIHRNLNLVVLDSRHPVTRDTLLPLGRLREKPSNLKRSDAVLITHTDEMIPLNADISYLAGLNGPSYPVFYSKHKPVSIRKAHSSEKVDIKTLSGPVGLVSAIGSPEGFKFTVKNMGIEVNYQKVFPDHYILSSADWFYAADEARNSGSACLLTTAKDETRFPRSLSTCLPVYVVDISLNIKQTSDFEALLLSVFNNE